MTKEYFTEAIQMVVEVNLMMVVVENIFHLILENIHQAHKRILEMNDKT
jgi:hypothetical protein